MKGELQNELTFELQRVSRQESTHGIEIYAVIGYQTSNGWNACQQPSLMPGYYEPEIERNTFAHGRIPVLKNEDGEPQGIVHYPGYWAYYGTLSEGGHLAIDDTNLWMMKGKNGAGPFAGKIECIATIDGDDTRRFIGKIESHNRANKEPIFLLHEQKWNKPHVDYDALPFEVVQQMIRSKVTPDEAMASYKKKD